MKAFTTYMVVVLLLSGCSTTLPINYIPSSSVRGTGIVSVGTIKYVPAENGQVAQNEFQKNALGVGKIYLSKDIASLIETALKKELVLSGFEVQHRSNFVIEADINRFYYDWIGLLEVDFELEIVFRLKENGRVIFEHNTFSHQKAPKTMATDTEAVRASISDCIDDFMLEARHRNII